jgi:hypothetical protein
VNEVYEDHILLLISLEWLFSGGKFGRSNGEACGFLLEDAANRFALELKQ